MTKEERGAGESRGTCAAPPRDRSRQTQRYGRRCHGRSRRANRNVVPRSEPLQYEKQITDSQGIIADKYQRIGKLQQEIKRCTPDMRKRSPTLNRRQQLLKTSVRIDNLFPHERDCRNGKTIARPSGRAGSSSQQTQQTPRGSNSNKRNLTRKSEPTSNERRKGRKWRFHHKAGRNEKAVPLSFFIQTNGPKLK